MSPALVDVEEQVYLVEDAPDGELARRGRRSEVRAPLEPGELTSQRLPVQRLRLQQRVRQHLRLCPCRRGRRRHPPRTASIACRSVARDVRRRREALQHNVAHGQVPRVGYASFASMLCRKHPSTFACSSGRVILGVRPRLSTGLPPIWLDVVPSSERWCHCRLRRLR